MPELTDKTPITTGKHGGQDGFCGIEYLRWKHGLPWGDLRPECMCPVLHSLIIQASDDPHTTEEERQRPGGLLERCCEAAWDTNDPEKTKQRMWRAADWAIKVANERIQAALASSEAQSQGDVAELRLDLAELAECTLSLADCPPCQDRARRLADAFVKASASSAPSPAEVEAAAKALYEISMHPRNDPPWAQADFADSRNFNLKAKVALAAARAATQEGDDA